MVITEAGRSREKDLWEGGAGNPRITYKASDQLHFAFLEERQSQQR